MSITNTKIYNTDASKTLLAEESIDGSDFIFLEFFPTGARYSTQCMMGHFEKADLISLVEKECDGVFIPRSEFPKVSNEFGRYSAPWSSADVFSTPDSTRATAVGFLAISEHIKAEAEAGKAEKAGQDEKVDRLANIIVGIVGVVPGGEHKNTTSEDLARALIERGDIELKEV